MVSMVERASAVKLADWRSLGDLYLTAAWGGAWSAVCECCGGRTWRVVRGPGGLGLVNAAVEGSRVKGRADQLGRGTLVS